MRGVEGPRGADPALAAALATAEGHAAMSGVPVLVTAESGAGKSRVVRHLADTAGRRVVQVNAAHLSPERAIADLCGVVRGAFTGAVVTRDGLLAEASGHILWIDEVHALSIDVQRALLTVIDTGEYRRVGDTGVRHADLWLVSSTNRCVWAEVDAGRMLHDFAHRIDVLRIEIAPVRERPEAIIDIAVEAASTWGLDLAPGAIDALCGGAWERVETPGNARRLRAVVLRAVSAARLEGAERVERRHIEADVARGARHGRRPSTEGARVPASHATMEPDIAAMVAENPGIRTRELVAMTGLSAPTVIDRLRRAGAAQIHGRLAGWWLR